MSGFLLDTNIVSELVKPKPEANVTEWVENTDESLLYLSVLTLGEIRRRIAILPRSRRRATLTSAALYPLARLYCRRSKRLFFHSVMMLLQMLMHLVCCKLWILVLNGRRNFAVLFQHLTEIGRCLRVVIACCPLVQRSDKFSMLFCVCLSPA